MWPGITPTSAMKLSQWQRYLSLQKPLKHTRVTSQKVVLSWGGRNESAFRAFLAICRDNFPCHNWGERECHLLSGRYRLGKLLTFCSVQDSPGQQRFPQPKILMVLRLRKPALQSSLVPEFSHLAL